MNTTSYLDRMLGPIADAMPIEFARKVVALRADDELLSQIDMLREKANAGSLTPAEEAEYKDFIDSLDLISILQSKARKTLAAHGAC